MADIDLQQRDPKDLNSHVLVEFEDVFGEPDELRSYEIIWYNADQCFRFCKSCRYIPLSLCYGICIAMGFGVELAGVTFRHVWCFTPCLRRLAITCGSLQYCCGTLVKCCIEPPCSSVAYICSRIRVTYR